MLCFDAEAKKNFDIKKTKWNFITSCSAKKYYNLTMDSSEGQDARVFVGNVAPDTDPALIEQHFKVCYYCWHKKYLFEKNSNHRIIIILLKNNL